VNGDSATWTIDRLARLAAAALAAGAPAQPNGRIREVPDVRTIRWYTSIGLLGRPAAMRGRTALYGRPHLAQLVAIKRLQADGLTVAAVQERLLGADEFAVEEIAMLPADLSGLVARVEAAEVGPAERAVPAVSAAPIGPADPAEAAGTAEPAEPAVLAAARKRFWVTPTTPPLEHEALEPNPHRDPALPDGFVRTTGHAVTPADFAPPILGIRLTRDVTLLLPPGREPDAAARTMIAEAAQPLLDLLDQLGLSDH
jgi:DNA-binding transcriptional MerR regulator